MTPINGRGGSRAFPTENRSRPSPEWNHYRITCNDGEVSLAVNGKVVTRGKECSPRKGYICLESEGGIVHYRNLKIKELPATPVKPEDVAIANRGYRSLYTGVDLSGWSTQSSDWNSRDWILQYRGSGGQDETLTAKLAVTRPGFLFDIRRKDGSVNHAVSIAGARLVIGPDDSEIHAHLAKGRGWNRIEGHFTADGLQLAVNGQPLPTRPLPKRPKETDAAMWSIQPGGPVDFANLFIRKSK